MRTKFVLFSILTLSSINAIAGEQYVPEKASRQLFRALQAAFPEAKNNHNHSVGVFLQSFECISNEDEYRCTGVTLEGQKLLLEGGSPIPSQQDENDRLNKLWTAMKNAKLPIEQGERDKSLSLSYITCDHLMPGSGPDSFECGFRK